MNKHTSRHSQWLAALVIFASFVARTSDATIVEFQTVVGNFEVNLYDNATPQTVANFLAYVNNGGYTNTIIHRSQPGFVVQGGGFAFDTAMPLDSVMTSAPVMNEPEFSNVRGTIAMAKLGGDPNSATSQWYFNLVDNSAGLDPQNGGFTVFGEVVGSGMDVVDAIAALPLYNVDSAITNAPTANLPLQNYSAADLANGVIPDARHLVIVSAVVVSDSTADSAAGLNPVPNTLINAPPPVPPATSNGSGGGGSSGVLMLLGLLFGYRVKRG